jgi:hypothetical protein
MTKVVALNLFSGPTKRPASAKGSRPEPFFVSGGDELETLRELKAVRDAKPSDEALAVEKGPRTYRAQAAVP